MKAEKGITMMSLMIYVISMVLVIGIISTITSFFYTNVMNLDDEGSNIAEITKFNMYFLQEVKNFNNEVTKQTDKSITFSTGNTFTFQDNAIYLNNIRICDGVKNCSIKINETSSKKIIEVLLTIGDNMEYTKTTNYVMSKI